jgi:hypothetical protein
MLIIAFRYLVLFLLLLLLMPLMAMTEETKKKDKQTQKWTITLGLVTRHVNPTDDTNESNRMLGLSYSNWVMTRFTNSYDEASVFGGRRFQTKELHLPRFNDFFIQGNLYAGFLHGYGDRLPNITGVTVAALPTAGIGYKKAVLEFTFIPTVRGGAFTSFLTYRF